MRRSLGTALLAAATGLLLLVTGAGTARAAGPSSGFDDWSCHPSAAHPEPVVLLHGLGGNGPGNFATLGPELALAGYCVYAPTYGEAVPGVPVGGLVPIERSSREIAADIDQVLAATGAAKVDLVGHSEGGFQSLYVPKFLPGYAAKIAKVVAIAPPTHGTTFANLITVADDLGIRAQVDDVLRTAGCAACTELTAGGTLVGPLNTGPIAQQGIDYTVIASRTDELVTPYGTEFVDEPGVHNVTVQDTCWLDLVGHIGLAYDSGVATMVGNALDPAHPLPVLCALGPII
ncbi:esterase/lipase family protein [Streptacidiphilus jiangxiensis]|uniref:Triacylglycerol esterase/lipase EstA, alpha/beta hydrolase fold n=1 Tax=Streptacidiphilus jiangxiensis TaxID=235985 RepID=A0A1H7VJS3_STRJI|nr:alpha/beta fold hydrolase [Streptacidiphilus jiangxiensis]SEM09274.1 Triacylglycerol esterase/lipase EstA, alpha/beta hydrolase fold [Streptacidiphilus jiangxiensis]